MNRHELAEIAAPRCAALVTALNRLVLSNGSLLAKFMTPSSEHDTLCPKITVTWWQGRRRTGNSKRHLGLLKSCLLIAARDDAECRRLTEELYEMCRVHSGFHYAIDVAETTCAKPEPPRLKGPARVFTPRTYSFSDKDKEFLKSLRISPGSD